MPAFTSIVLASVAATAAAGTGYAIAAGEEQKRAQANSMQQQQRAQQQAVAQAEAQSAKSQEAINAANRKAPDVSGILSSAARQASGGPSGTMLTGPGGVNPAQLPLGRSTLLGE